MDRIDLSKCQGRTYKVLSGVDLGKNARQEYKLDVLDTQDQVVTFSVPESVYSLNSSYFAGLFQKSLSVLGEHGFREKYKFECSEIIQANIEDGIFYVQNTKDPLGD